MLKISEFLVLHILFGAIVAEQLGGELPLPASVKALFQGSGFPAQGPSEESQRWLALLDFCLAPPVFRTGIQKQMPDEEALRAVVRYFVFKNPHGQDDCDRLDWLLSYIFKRRVAAGNPTDPATLRSHIQGWLDDVRYQPLSETAQNLVSEVTAVAAEAAQVRAFDQLTESGLIARAREIKKGFREEFFHPQALAALVHYNLVFGRRFDQLFVEAAQQAREFAASIAEKDYRSTAEDFRKLGSAAKKGKARAGGAAESAPVAAAPPAYTPLSTAARPPADAFSGGSAARAPVPPGVAMPGDGGVRPGDEALPVRGPRAPEQDPVARMRALGIDPQGQITRLKSAAGEIAGFIQSAGREVRQVPLANTTLSVTEWESAAFAVDFPATETSFRAEFARLVRIAVASVARIHEELALYEQKRNTEYLWKPHYDALIYLLYFGQQQLARLDQLTQDTRARGLGEKADQLAKTGARLRGYVSQVANLFEKQ